MNVVKSILSFYLWFGSFSLLMADPVVTAVSPTNGQATGGTIVTITGKGFSGASAVHFGKYNAPGFTVISDAMISVPSPAGVFGTFDVTVTAGGKTSPIVRADYFTYTQDSWRGLVSTNNPDQILIFDTATNTIIESIPLAANSLTATITPDGTTIYAANDANLPASVYVIDTATRTLITTITIPGIQDAFDAIVSPDGKKVYVSYGNFSYPNVAVIDTTTNTLETILSFLGPSFLGPISITPDGSTLYVSNFTSGEVTPVFTSNYAQQTPIVVGPSLTGCAGNIAITTDGIKAFAAGWNANQIVVIDVATNTAVGSPIAFPLGSGPYGSTLLPGNKTMYVTNLNNDTVSIVDLTNNTYPITTPAALNLPAGSQPFWAVTTPDGKTVYFVTEDTNIPSTIRAIDVATNTYAPFPSLSPPASIQDIIMTADQAPVAYFTAKLNHPGVPSTFDASASLSPIGTIASYAWDFGDGTTAVTTSPTISHTYASSGTYNAQLIVTNTAGTSIYKVFSSGLMSNNGGPQALLSQALEFPFSPNNVNGCQKSSRFLSQTDLINVISWAPPAEGNTPAAYQIYRDPELTCLVGTVPGKCTSFRDHNRKKNVVDTYYVVSVASQGGMSEPVRVTVQPCQCN